MRLSIVIPFSNEESNVETTINKTDEFLKRNKLNGEIIAVDDRSTDNTGKLLDSISKKIKCLKVIHRKGNQKDVEIGYAIRDGIKSARFDTISVMMGDLSDNPDDIKRMLKKVREGYDVVCGSRFIKGSKLVNYPLLKLIMVRFYNTIFSFLFGLNIKDFSNAFKTYRKYVFETIKLESKEFEITAEIVLKAYIKKFKITEVPVSWYNRKQGKSKLGSFSFSSNFILKRLPQIGFRYGLLALRLYVNYLLSKLRLS